MMIRGREGEEGLLAIEERVLDLIGRGVRDVIHIASPTGEECQVVLLFHSSLVGRRLQCVLHG